MFTHFTKRLERDINRKVKERHDFQVKKYPGMALKAVDVHVITHPFQRFAVWFGGSMLASQPEVCLPTLSFSSLSVIDCCG
jgi:actin-related protein 3